MRKWKAGPLSFLRNKVEAFFRERKYLSRWALGLGTGLGVALFLWAHFLPPEVRLELGQRSPVEIRAPKSATYIDTQATERLRKEAVARVTPQFKPDKEAITEAEEALSSLFAEAMNLASSEGEVKDRASRLAERLALPLPQRTLEALVEASPSALKQMKGYASSLLRRVMEAGIKDLPKDMERARREAQRRAKALGLRPPYSECVGQIVAGVLRPTLLYDPKATEALRREAAERVKPVVGKIKGGEVVIREGERVNRGHLEQIKALGLLHPRLNLSQVLAGLMVAFLLVFLFGAYLKRADLDSFRSTGSLAALSISGLMALGGHELLGQFPHGFLFSAGLGGAAASALTSARAGVGVALLLAALLAFVSPTPQLTGLAASISGLVGVCLASKVARRADFLKVGVGLALVNAFILSLIGLATGKGLKASSLDASWGMTFGALSALSVVVLTWLLERPLGLATQPRLLELSSPDHPLLRQMVEVAPGTFHSSLLVGEMASSAAEATGADPLLAYVGGLYHDIGKMRRPQCFVENQEGENIHQRLNPTLSAKIIISHVKEGAELALKHKLPPAVVDIIAQHHGTTLVQYFYHEAANGKGGKRSPTEEEFRYPGPKPRSKEAAIVMLADSVEAAVRVMEEPDPPKLKGLVEALLESRLKDGQLDESELTFKDLEGIKEAFVRILMGVFHRRIPYPGQEGATRKYGQGVSSEAHKRKGPPKPRITSRSSGA